MPPIVVVAADLLVAASPLLLARLGDPPWGVRPLLVPALTLGSVALLVAFVFGEDSYRGNGISRWDAYRSPGGALGPMFFVTVVLLTSCAGAMVVAVMRRRRRLLQVSAVGAAVVALLLGIPTAIGFSVN